jgi:RNA polymerase sigma factor (sigma-70 family)
MANEEYEQMSDAALVSECRNGSKRAWEVFVRRFQRLIYTVPRRAGLSDEQAADVFQIVFSKAFEHLESITQPDRIQAWLVTTAKRESLALLRDRRSTVSIGEPEEEGGEVYDVPDENPLPEELLESLQLQHELHEAVKLLDPKSQEFVKLVFLQDEPLPYSEIAARLGISEGSIGPTRTRCLEKLRSALNKKK